MNLGPTEQQRTPSPERHVEVLEIATEQDWRSAGEALKILRPDLDVETFVSSRSELVSMGYRLIGAKIEGEVVSVASFTISPHAMHRKELLVHDMATKREFAGNGYGSLLLGFIETIAQHEKCFRVFVHTKNATGFYEHNGFETYSTGLIKRING